MRRTIGDVRLAVRCSPRELRAIDSFVLRGEFRTRSVLVRTALNEYLNSRLKEVTREFRSVEGQLVSLRGEELDLLTRYAKLVHGGDLPAALAMLVRHGMKDLKVDEMVQVAERQLKNAPVRAREDELDRATLELMKGELFGEAEEQRQKSRW